MQVINAVWEKRNLGVEAAEVIVDGGDQIHDLETVQAQLDEEYDYICLKTNVCHPDFLMGLQKLGYSFIETQIALLYREQDKNPSRLVLEMEKEYVPRYDFVDITENDLLFSGMLKRIKEEEMFTTDRVYLDNSFAPQRAGERYEGWCHDLRQQGARFLETIVDGTITGFTVYRQRSEHVFDSPLGGNYKETDNFSLLSPWGSIAFFEYLKKLGMKKLYTWVSSNNTVILKFHLMAGYCIQDLKYVYIKHPSK